MNIYIYIYIYSYIHIQFDRKSASQHIFWVAPKRAETPQNPFVIVLKHFGMPRNSVGGGRAFSGHPENLLEGGWNCFESFETPQNTFGIVFNRSGAPRKHFGGDGVASKRSETICFVCCAFRGVSGQPKTKLGGPDPRHNVYVCMYVCVCVCVCVRM